MTDIRPIKVLGRKAYGSIGHLPDSQLGPGDHHVHEGQALICTVKAKDKHQRIWVQEKLDGSCVAVANVDGVLHPLGRAGHAAVSSKYEQHRLFHNWVMSQQDRFLAVIQPGERLVGEWLAQAHGTVYRLPHEPFVAFDIMRETERLTLDRFRERISPVSLWWPRLLGTGPMSVAEVLERLRDTSHHGAVGQCEGAVWRVERGDEVEFLAKWVRPGHNVGGLLPEMSGQEPVWNWRPEAAR